MNTLIRQSLAMLLLMSALTGAIYPLAVTSIAQMAFPRQANGSVVERDGKAVGSVLIGQSFTDPRYFWGRPSATSPYPYATVPSGASNLGPNHPALLEAVRQRVAALQSADPDNRLPVPVDLITASGSGLDPDISPAAAAYQIARVARLRGVSTTAVQALVDKSTAGRWLGVLGEPRVNVLQLNLALDGR